MALYLRLYAVLVAAALLAAVPSIDATRKLQQVSPHAQIIPRKYIVQLASGIESLTSAAPPSAGALIDEVQTSNIPIKSIRAFDSDIFRGVTIAAGTDEDARQLLHQLNADSRVAAIYPVTGIKLPKPVPASPQRPAVPSPAAAAANHASGAGTDGITPDGLISQPQPVAPTADVQSKYASNYSSSLDQSGGGVDSVSMASTPQDTIRYPDVELPLGAKGERVRFKPSQSWGVADYVTNVTMLRQKYGLTGRGVRIAIIDSGIDYRHPAFGECTAVNTPAGKCRVVAGYDFVGDDFDLPTDTPRPKADPMDCSEVRHGTSVAGVAAAGYVPGAPMIGVAPEAELGIYKVYGCEGTGTTDALLAAIQRAVDDKMDIINLSLGEPSGYAAEPWTSIMQAVFAKGIIVIRTAGNDGSIEGGQGLFYADGHTASGALVVGGINTASADKRYIGPSAFSSLGPDPELNLLPHVLGPAEQFVTTYSNGRYTTRDENSPMGPVSGTSFAAPYTAGAIALALQLHRQNEQQQQTSSNQAGIAALQQKGTRKKDRLTFDQQFVTDQMIRTAVQWDTNGLASLESTAKQGAGSFDIGAFVTNPVITTPTVISLPSDFNIHRQKVTLYYTPQDPDVSSNNITYQITHQGAAAYEIPKDGWGRVALTPFDGTVMDLFASVKITPEYVTLSPGDKKTVTVTFYLPQMLKKKHVMYSGYIKLTPVDSIPENSTAAESIHSSSSSSTNSSDNNNTSAAADSKLLPIEQLGGSGSSSSSGDASEVQLPPVDVHLGGSAPGSSSSGNNSSSSGASVIGNSNSTVSQGNSSLTNQQQQQQQQNGRSGKQQAQQRHTPVGRKARPQQQQQQQQQEIHSEAQQTIAANQTQTQQHQQQPDGDQPDNQAQQQLQQQAAAPTSSSWMIKHIPNAPKRSDPVPIIEWPAAAAAAKQNGSSQAEAADQAVTGGGSSSSSNGTKVDIDLDLQQQQGEVVAAPAAATARSQRIDNKPKAASSSSSSRGGSAAAAAAAAAVAALKEQSADKGTTPEVMKSPAPAAAPANADPPLKAAAAGRGQNAAPDPAAAAARLVAVAALKAESLTKGTTPDIGGLPAAAAAAAVSAQPVSPVVPAAAAKADPPLKAAAANKGQTAAATPAAVAAAASAAATRLAAVAALKAESLTKGTTPEIVEVFSLAAATPAAATAQSHKTKANPRSKLAGNTATAAAAAADATNTTGEVQQDADTSHPNQAAVKAAAVAAAKIMREAINGALGRRWLLESQQAQGSESGVISDVTLDSNTKVTSDAVEAGLITDLEASLLSSSSGGSSSSGVQGYQVDGLLDGSSSSSSSLHEPELFGMSADATEPGGSSSSSNITGLSDQELFGYQLDGLPAAAAAAGSSSSAGLIQPRPSGYEPDGFFDDLFDTQGDNRMFDTSDNNIYNNLDSAQLETVSNSPDLSLDVSAIASRLRQQFTPKAGQPAQSEQQQWQKLWQKLWPQQQQQQLRPDKGQRSEDVSRQRSHAAHDDHTAETEQQQQWLEEQQWAEEQPSDSGRASRSDRHRDHTKQQQQQQHEDEDGTESRRHRDRDHDRDRSTRSRRRAERRSASDDDHDQDQDRNRDDRRSRRDRDSNTRQHRDPSYDHHDRDHDHERDDRSRDRSDRRDRHADSDRESDIDLQSDQDQGWDWENDMPGQQQQQQQQWAEDGPGKDGMSGMILHNGMTAREEAAAQIYEQQQWQQQGQQPRKGLISESMLDKRLNANDQIDDQQQWQQQQQHPPKGLISEGVPHHRLPADQNWQQQWQQQQQWQEEEQPPKGLISEGVPHHRLPADQSGQQQQQWQQQQWQEEQQAPGKGLIAENVPHHRLPADQNGQQQQWQQQQWQQQQRPATGLISESVPHKRLTADGVPIKQNKQERQQQQEQQQQQKRPATGLISEGVPHKRLTADGAPIKQHKQERQQQLVGLSSETVPYQEMTADGVSNKQKQQQQQQPWGSQMRRLQHATGFTSELSPQHKSSSTPATVVPVARMHNPIATDAQYGDLTHAAAAASPAAAAAALGSQNTFAASNRTAAALSQISPKAKSLTRVPANRRSRLETRESGNSESADIRNRTGDLSSSSSENPAAAPATSATVRVQAVPLVIPYQGAAGYSTTLPVAMSPGMRNNVFCYTPNTNNVLTDNVINPAMHVMDFGCEKMSVASSKYFKAPAIEVLMSQIEEYPCALTFTLAAVLPVRRMIVELTQGAEVLGTIQSLETPIYSRSPAGTPYSYCLDWAGTYTTLDNTKTQIQAGQEYGMKVLLEAPLAAADRAAGMEPRLVTVDIQGSFKVVDG